MALESYVMADDKGILPEYEGKPTGELWKEYASLHEINPEKRINKVRAREKKLRHHRKSLTQIIDSELGKDKEGQQNESLEHIESERAKKEKAASIIAKIAHEHYKTDDKNAKKPDVRQIRRYLQEVGLQATGQPLNYEDVIKAVMNAGDLRYEGLSDEHPLKQMLDQTSLYKHPEGYKITHLQRTLSRPEHQEGLRKLIGGEVEKEFKTAATPIEMFREHQAHVTELDHKYGLTRETTYAKPRKGGGH